MEDPVVPLERNLYGHLLAGLLWEKQFETVPLEHGWRKVLNWECSFVNRARGLFLAVYVDDIELAGKTENIEPTLKILMEDVDLGEPTSFLDHVYLGCTQRECQTSKDIVDINRNTFASKISAGQRILRQTFSHGPMTWKVMQRNAWKDLANLRTKRLNSYTKSQLHVLTTINSKKKKWDLLENCQKVLLTDCSEMLVFSSNW